MDLLGFSLSTPALHSDVRIVYGGKCEKDVLVTLSVLNSVSMQSNTKQMITSVSHFLLCITEGPNARYRIVLFSVCATSLCLAP